jgi:methyl acetate hydrolase
MDIAQTLKDAVAAGDVPGVAAAAATDGGVIFEGAAGGLQPDSVIWIASMTKAIASVAALQLIERGELELDQQVREILPAFGELGVLEGFDSDEPRLRPPARQATIRNLFTHTAGPSYWFGNADLLRYLQLTGAPDPSTGRLAALLDVPLVADPGTIFEYGTSVDWLGQVIEAISGQDLATYCEQHIFGPLGMVDATFRPSEEQLARKMSVHARTADGGLLATGYGPLAEPEFWSAGAGAFATAPDYLRFMRALLRGGELDGERILRPETVELAFRDHLEGAKQPEIMRSAIPELTNDVPALPFAQGFGLGFHLFLEDIPGMRRAGTGDWAGLANCFYWIDRTTGVAGTVMTQVLPFFDGPILETVLGFEQAVYAQVEALAS